MPRLSVLTLLLILSPAAAYGEVVVERFEEPILAATDPRVGSAAAETSEAAPSLVPKGTRAEDKLWFIPFYKVDTSAGLATSTFFSIRNETDSGANATVAVDYRNTLFGQQKSEGFNLAPHQVKSRNLREVPGLEVDPDGFARGVVRMTPGAGQSISVDLFQIDAANDFGTGSSAFVFPDDFCTNWMVRFLRFGGLSGGSVLTFLVNGARGADSGDPPSVTGNVYNEAGVFINSFIIRTDEWAFERNALDFVLGGTSFGSMELVIDGSSSPDGLVAVSHSAFGKFSVGTQGVCRDDV